MSTEQEISGAEREAMENAFEHISRQVPDLIFPGGKAEEDALYEGVWRRCREYVGEQRQRADMAEASQHSTRVLLEEEEAENEDNRRILSMAEEREKALEEKIARAAAALVYLAPALDALGVALLHGDPLAELRVRFSDLIPEIEKAVSILGDTDVS